MGLMTSDQIDEMYDTAYKVGYEQGVRDFAKRIRERDRTWSISEIESDLIGEKDAKANSNM